MAKAPFLVELSWEVCNKVGGIHTVIVSKLSHSLKAFPDSYISVGPLVANNAHPEFSERPLPDELQAPAEQLKAQGVTLSYGVWQVPEEPPVILLGWEGLIPKANEYKSAFWERFKLDTLGSNFYDIDQPLLWGIACGLFLRAFAASKDRPVIAHCHEWLSAGTILELEAEKPKNLKTVFTTHATVLGRALMNRDRNIYANMASIDPAKEAAACGVLTKHQLETLSARKADAFTAVSDITAGEAEVFLGRKPDKVTKNGIGDQFPTFDKLSISRQAVRERLHSFVAAYFFPSYRFDLSKVSYQYAMGRYEPHNKGYDLYAAALGRLNETLKEEKSDKTVISFFLVPGDAGALRPEAASQLTIYQRVAASLQRFSAGQQQAAYGQAVAGTFEELREKLVPEERRETIDHVVSHLPRPSAPEASPFALKAGQNDDIVKAFRENGLLNREEDRVKAVFIPVYLDGFDGLFNVALYELVTAFDLGVFPSFYEPWGYTPLESIALGVPAVTTDLTGFGRAVAALQPSAAGVDILTRSQGTRDQQRDALAALLSDSLSLSPRQEVDRKIAAYATAYRFSWDLLYPAYAETYAKALAS